jgi:hypothetical protein
MLRRLDTISASIRTLLIAVLQVNMRNIVRNGNIRGLVNTNWDVTQRDKGFNDNVNTRGGVKENKTNCQKQEKIGPYWIENLLQKYSRETENPPIGAKYPASMCYYMISFIDILKPIDKHSGSCCTNKDTARSFPQFSFDICRER